MHRLSLLALLALVVLALGAPATHAAPPLEKGTYTCEPVTAENRLEPPPTPPHLRAAAASLSEAERADLMPERKPCGDGEVAVPVPIEDATPPRVPSPDRVAAQGVQALAASNYAYAGDIWQQSGAIGLYMESWMPQPYISGSPGAHSLGQLAIANNASIYYTVELGWNVDATLYPGSYLPHLFIFGTRDGYTPGAGSCYNCNFIPAAGASYTPGQTFSPASALVSFQVQYYQGNWWFWFGNQWIGYMPGSFWYGAFTGGSVQQVYGEIYDAWWPPTTDMGNGLYGSNGGAAQMSNPYLLLPPANWMTLALHRPPVNITNSSWYSIGSISANRRTWRFGGNGAG